MIGVAVSDRYGGVAAVLLTDLEKGKKRIILGDTRKKVHFQYEPQCEIILSHETCHIVLWEIEGFDPFHRFDYYDRAGKLHKEFIIVDDKQLEEKE